MKDNFHDNLTTEYIKTFAEQIQHADSSALRRASVIITHLISRSEAAENQISAIAKAVDRHTTYQMPLTSRVAELAESYERLNETYGQEMIRVAHLKVEVGFLKDEINILRARLNHEEI